MLSAEGNMLPTPPVGISPAAALRFLLLRTTDNGPRRRSDADGTRMTPLDAPSYDASPLISFPTAPPSFPAPPPRARALSLSLALLSLSLALSQSLAAMKRTLAEHARQLVALAELKADKEDVDAALARKADQDALSSLQELLARLRAEVVLQGDDAVVMSW